MRNKTVLNMRIFFIYVLLIFVVNLSAQNTTQNTQKLYVTTDKLRYKAGETIWIKTYLTDQYGNLDTTCHQINLQLLFPDNSVAYSQIHKLQKGCSNGQIAIPDTASGGHYTLRAYTNEMRNFGDSNIVLKNIYIENSENIFYTETYFSGVKRQNRLKKKYEKNAKSLTYLSNTLTETDIFSIQIRENTDSVQLKISNKNTIEKNLSISLSVTQNSEIETKYFYEIAPKHSKTSNRKTKYLPEKSLKVSGTIYKLMFEQAAENALVQLFVLNEHYKKLTTTTDSSGRFEFDGLDYPDTMELKIESYAPSGKLAYIVSIDEPDYPKSLKILPENLDEELYWLKQGRKQARARYNYEIQQDTSSIGRIHHAVNQVIYFDKINVAGYSGTLAVIATYVPGVSLFGESTLRGKTSFTLSSEPMYLLDGVPVSKSTIESLPPEQVERVEIVKGTNAAIYGSRAANGVIAVYTKQGYNIQIGHVTFKQIGYHSAQLFSRAHHVRNHTLLWVPNLEFEENNSAVVNIPKSENGIYYIEIQGFIGHQFVKQTFITD